MIVCIKNTGGDFQNKTEAIIRHLVAYDLDKGVRSAGLLIYIYNYSGVLRISLCAYIIYTYMLSTFSSLSTSLSLSPDWEARTWLSKMLLTSSTRSFSSFAGRGTSVQRWGAGQQRQSSEEQCIVTVKSTHWL